MKKILSTSDYVFTAASQIIDFSSLVGFDSKRVMAVINTTAGQTLIYAVGGGISSPTGGSFSGNILTLNYNTTSMADSDNLQIIYDVQAGVEDSRSTIDVVTGKFGADFNLLNSSFGGEIGSVLPSVSPDNALSVAVLNGGILSAPSMNVNDELIVDVTQSGNVPVVVGNTVSSLIVDSGGSPLIGQQVSASSIPVVLPSNQTVPVSQNEIYITGQATLTVGNNLLLATAGAGSTDALGYKTGSVQIVSAATSGTFLFEHSNDNVNFQPLPVFRTDSVSPNAIVTAITPTASSFIYHFPIKSRYIRCRIATVLNTNIQAFLRLSQESWAPIVPQVVNATAGNLNATVAGTLTSVGTITTVTGVTTVSTVTAASLAATTITDIASAAITTTQTSANIVTGNQQNMAFQVSVTGASGTGQTLDVVVQETFDGTNYYDIYHFPRITTVGQYRSPQIRTTGAGIRYVRTVGGVTPSFTNSVIRPVRQTSSDIWRNFVNRVIDPNTLNSTTVSYLVEGCDQFQLAITMNAGGTAPQFKLQGSNDDLNWYDVPSTTITATVGSTVQVVSAAQCLPKFVRGITSTAGTGSSLFCLCITARGV